MAQELAKLEPLGRVLVQHASEQVWKAPLLHNYVQLLGNRLGRRREWISILDVIVFVDKNVLVLEVSVDNALGSACSAWPR